MELSLNLSHGEAVANGLYYETLLAYNLNRCKIAYLDKWTKEIRSRFTLYPLTDKILDLTLNDKKNDGNTVAFALPSDFQTVRLPLERVKSLLL